MIIRSDCHEPWVKEWRPEVGSKAYQGRWNDATPTFCKEAIALFVEATEIMRGPYGMKAIDRILKVDMPSGWRRRPKTHWQGSTHCRHVALGTGKDILTGDLFADTNRDERCVNCDWSFCNS